MFLRSSLLGNVIGIVPGAGATIASFVSYGLEAQFGKRTGRMGTGIAEGIVAPQAAATASVGGALVPLLALGIPGSGATAVILGAFMLHGHPAGTAGLRAPRPAMVYTVFASLFLGLALMCLIGYFADPPAGEDPRLSRGRGVGLRAGAVLHRRAVDPQQRRRPVADDRLRRTRLSASSALRFPIAPLVLGVILGPLAEESFMNSMISFQNDWTVFFTRPDRRHGDGVHGARSAAAGVPAVARTPRGGRLT